MRILKEGVDPDKVPRWGQCMHCKTVVEFLPSEATTSTDRNETFYEVRCPVCARPITTSSGKNNWSVNMPPERLL